MLEDVPADRIEYASDVALVTTPGAMEDGTPGLAILLILPGGRYALGGMHLLNLVDELLEETQATGYSMRLPVIGAVLPPDHTAN